MPHRLVSDAAAAAIVEAYLRGDKIRDIEERFSVPRATVYWILEKADVAPNRAQTNRRLVGNDQQLAALYALITSQDERIKELSERLAKYETVEYDE